MSNLSFVGCCILIDLISNANVNQMFSFLFSLSFDNDQENDSTDTDSTNTDSTDTDSTFSTNKVHQNMLVYLLRHMPLKSNFFPIMLNKRLFTCFTYFSKLLKY